MGFVRPGDTETIAVSIDFLGVNYYSRDIVRSSAIPEEENEPRSVFPGPQVTAMGWEAYPHGLYQVLTWLHAEYPFDAFFVTENGAAFDDVVRPDGSVDDPARVIYLRHHLQAAAAAIGDGVPVKGYFVWSLMDNFEWSFGFSKRFGLVYVDYATQKRVPKSSAGWYRGVIAAGGIRDEDSPIEVQD